MKDRSKILFARVQVLTAMTACVSLIASPLLNFAIANEGRREEHLLVWLLAAGLCLFCVIACFAISRILRVPFSIPLLGLSVFVFSLFLFKDISGILGLESLKISLPLWLFGTCIAVLTVRKLAKSSQGLVAMQIFFVSILLYPLARSVAVIAAPEAGYGTARYEGFNVSQMPDEIMSHREPPRIRPNVYFISQDSYVRHDVLMELYHYDNGPFIQFATKLGFVFPRGTYSNYNFTLASLLTTWNMTYLLPSMDVSFLWNLSWIRANVISGETIVARELKRRGYTYIFANNGFFDKLKCSRYNEVCLEPMRTSYEFLSGLSYLSPVPQLVYRFRKNLPDGLVAWLNPEASGQAVYQSFTVDRLASLDLARYKQPFFLFLHTVGMHNFAWDSNCRRRPPHEIPGWISTPTIRRAYSEQLNCLNRMTLSSIRAIVQKDPGALIVLQADHGTFSIGDLRRRDRAEWVRTEAAKELFAILNAYRLPKECGHLPYDGISPVNTFRMVFACLDGRRYPYIPDRHFVLSDPRWKGHPFVEEIRFDATP
ncbi:MAG TPA: hypothetical protein VJT81_18910 [Burkholderiales bacterium]|nr:hypothetical protein [Burkholderiales bacterium]